MNPTPQIHDLIQKIKPPCVGAIGQVIAVDDSQAFCFTRHPLNKQTDLEFFALPHGEYAVVGRAKIQFPKALEGMQQQKPALQPKVVQPQFERSILAEPWPAQTPPPLATPEPAPRIISTDAPGLAPSVPVDESLQPVPSVPVQDFAQQLANVVLPPAPKRRGRPPNVRSEVQ